MAKNRVLGRGLSALISENKMEYNAQASAEEPKITLPIESIYSNDMQPRKKFSEEQLKELSESIRRNGVITPILVRPTNMPGRYQIVAGERRWRASKLAGLSSLPVVVKEISDKESLEIALIENMQREDLSILEEAEGLRLLIEEYSYTQEQLAQAVAKSRSHVANLLRLLSLPGQVKKYINEGKLTMGHARALVNSERAIEIAETVIKEGFNVRQTEKLVSEFQETKSKKPKSKKNVSNDIHEDLRGLEEALSKNLGMKVKIEDGDKGGKVTIHFNNLEQLDKVLQKLNSELPTI
jgi:ParB family chromosome partitioning protein